MTATITKTEATLTVPRSELARALKALASTRAKHAHITIGERVTVAGFVPEVAVRATLDADEGERREFEAPVLTEALRRALPFASTDPTRPVLCNVAVYPDARVVASTDSYRLAVIRYGDGPDKPEEPPLLVGTTAAKSIRSVIGRKLGTVTVTTRDDHFLVDFEDVRWSLTRDREAKYPQWWTLFPDADGATVVKVDRDDILAASRAADAVATRNAPLRFHADGTASITVSDAATGHEGNMTRRLSTATVEGESMEVGFNPEFVADACNMATAERLVVRLIGPLRPALFESGRDRFLLMPIRLNV